MIQTITIRNDKGVHAYDVNNIIRIQGMSNYCKIFFADNRRPLTVAKVLHWFQDNLPAEMFWRTHKTHLVNSIYIQTIVPSLKPYLILQSGELVSVSRRRAKQFKAIG